MLRTLAPLVTKKHDEGREIEFSDPPLREGVVMRRVVIAFVAIFMGCTTTLLGPGTRSFDSNAAILGAVGIKRSLPNKGGHFFDRQLVPAWRTLQVHNAGVVTRDESYVRQLKKLGLSAPAVAAIETSAAYKKQKKAQLVTLQIRDNTAVAKELLALAAADPFVAATLRTTDMHLVTSVEAIFGHEVTSELQIGGDATLTAVGTTSVELNFTTENKRKVKLSDGTIVSYQLARMCWSKDGELLHLQRDIDDGAACPGDMVSRFVGPVAETCPSIAGKWRRDHDRVGLTINQTGCKISASAPDVDVSHWFDGVYSGGTFHYQTRRRNETTKCETVMTGYIHVSNPDMIRMIVVGSDGKCELPSDFRENFTWHRDN
jgi:hypothetical protein